MPTTTTPLYEKQQRILKYFQLLATFVRKANEVTMALPRLDAESALAPMDQQTSRAITEQRKMLEQLKTTATEKACETAHRETLEHAEDLVQQLEARLQSAEEIERGIRAYEANLELAITLGEFDTAPDDRATAEARLDEMRTRLATQIDLADQLVPVTSSVLVLH